MLKTAIFVFAAIMAYPAISSGQGLPGGIGEASIRETAAGSFPEYFDFLSLPNDSIRPADIRANAAWLTAAFEKRGFHAKELANNGKPLVFAEFGTPDAALKTVLFYLHFDGQPVIDAQWAQPSPWQPVVKKRGEAGAWIETGRAALMRPDFDPELRVFARSSSDDKGPIMMFLADMDLLKQKGLRPAVNVKVLLDSEEEVNSPGIAGAVAANKDILTADALVILDAAAHPSGRPTAMFGNRGLLAIRLTVFGPKSPLHSGHYGNYIPNPAFGLAQLLASMKDGDGRVTIPGFYARTMLTSEDRAIMREAGDDEAALRKRVGVARAERVAETYQEALQFPSLNIRGMAAAAVGDKAANIIPADAVAEIDVRTSVEAGPDYLLPLIRAHIEKQGFHIAERAPSDEERAQYPKLAQLVQTGTAAEAARQPMDTPIGRWANAALTAAYQNAEKPLKPVRLRMMGATVPTHQIVAPLGMPFVLVPVVNPDNNQHSFDENLRMGHYLTGMRTILGLLTTPY